MDENIVAQAETEELDGLDQETLAAIDSDWGDEDLTAEDSREESEPEEAEEAEEPEDAGDAQTEGEPADEAGKTGTAGAEQPAEDQTGDKQPEEGHQTFSLKVNGQTREVGLEEMRALAQKGADYDGIRADRDALREQKAKGEKYEAFLTEMAEAGGVSVDELMESTRASMLIQKAKAEGRTLSEEDARAQVKAKEAKETKPEPEKAPEKTPEEKARETIQRFLDLYPDVKGTDIPKEVWDQAEKTGDLIAPYQRWQAQQLKAEKQQLEQNRKNRERSTGSRKSAGQSSMDKAFDAAWYDGT